MYPHPTHCEGFDVVFSFDFDRRIGNPEIPFVANHRHLHLASGQGTAFKVPHLRVVPTMLEAGKGDVVAAFFGANVHFFLIDKGAAKKRLHQTHFVGTAGDVESFKRNISHCSYLLEQIPQRGGIIPRYSFGATMHTTWDCLYLSTIY